MQDKENLREFYNSICYHPDEIISNEKPHVNVFARNSCEKASNMSRRDFYKVTLVLGTGLLEYADKSFQIIKPAILFTSPKVPYTWKPDAGSQLGWFCIFNEAFVRQQDDLLANLKMFQTGTDKLSYIDEKTVGEISQLFLKMMEENEEDYDHKQDLIRNYLHLIIHKVLKVNPAESTTHNNNASEMITSLFLELLERQFPIDSVHHQLKLKSASDFAGQLSVHTNHLNRAVKEITGETTTMHIAKRTVIEANAMLRHNNWPVEEIAFSLGFENPAYFTNFYKKHTGVTPKQAKNY